MKAVYKVDERLTFELEATDQKGIFAELSSIQEIFGESQCGKCNSHDLKFVVREVDDNKYYEIRCKKCGAKFSFGQAKKGGTLFPKKKDADGKWFNSGGWLKWNSETKTEE